VLTYDERASHQHDYGRLYELLDLWKTAHLQNSVWLVDRSGTAAQVRDAMKTHMHTDDTICVVEISPTGDWATLSARETGNDLVKVSHSLSQKLSDNRISMFRVLLFVKQPKFAIS
jgi:hypothetical protein